VLAKSNVSRLPRASRRQQVALALPFAAALVVLGLRGLYRYIDNFWVYRGFAPPHDPAYVTQRGTAARFYVKSGVIGGLSQPVDVYLPPGYAAHPHERYPVVYLLHGFPGKPGAFLLTVRMGVEEDSLVAQHRMKPVILVMPFGSTGQFTDKEWANGVQPDQRWATFLSRDVVRAVEARYRVIPGGAARALAGLSEGGYGAINIALHNPGEFRTVESWSGYETADPIRSIFGGNPRLLASNSPLLELPKVARALRRDGTYFWFYIGATDGTRSERENRAFAAELTRDHIPHRYFVVSGGHTWAVWRRFAPQALLAAAHQLRDG
jgi:enterochelin esterase-like enzyme